MMMDAISDKRITKLDLSHNAFGPQGIESFTDFLTKADYLKFLDVSNCGLSPKGGRMIANALLLNPKMKLRHFAASRSRLKESVKNLAEVFKHQRSIEYLDLQQNVSKRGLPILLESLLHCKGTLRELYINDNKSINRAISQLSRVILQCTRLKVLNISDLNMRK